MKYNQEKQIFLSQLKQFALTLEQHVATKDEWTIRGFIDICKNIYTISSDTKVVSKILELQLFPHFLTFAKTVGYRIELATHQNWYPDLTFINLQNQNIKFAVDLKTTYNLPGYPGFCNGFTLGSHGEYFTNPTSTKNIQYPYSSYAGHFCLGIIYSRTALSKTEETKIYTVADLPSIPAVLHHFTFFAEEKWKIASDMSGSGNTANIGSIQKISDILSGNGVFAKAGETYFNDYWANYKRLTITTTTGKSKKLSSFKEYLQYRNLPEALYNPKATKRKGKILHDNG